MFDPLIKRRTLKQRSDDDLSYLFDIYLSSL